MSIRILLVEDHPMFRDGLRAVFDRCDDFDVVGEAATAAEAFELIQSRRPNVVILDLQLPDRPGTEVAQNILAEDLGARVLVISAKDDNASIVAAFRAGVLGYLTKGCGKEEILHSVRLVAVGGTALSEPISALLRDWITAEPAASTKAFFPTLTERERTVLDLLAAGWENSQIASELGIVEKTVRNHLSNLFVKLQVSNRAQAMLVARTAGMRTS